MSFLTDIASWRQQYNRHSLPDAPLPANPLVLFALWFEAWATTQDPNRIDTNAMILATATPNGKPSVRAVLLKGFDENGFVFYTNYLSRKGNELTANPQASILFYWPSLERQVRVEGIVVKTSAQESVEYFASRPRESQLAAVASHQSQPVANQQALQALFDAAQQQFAPNAPVVCPTHWGGYRLQPNYVDFWQGRPNRLHDRITYSLLINDPPETNTSRTADSNWTIQRLAP